MRISRFMALACLAACVSAGPGMAQQGEPYKPVMGQQGKDVIWVPSSDAVVAAMLKVARVGPADYVVDLGSGDGRTVVMAAKRGAKALGIEYNADLVNLSKRRAALEGVGDRAQFVQADLFETDFSQATVVTMFLLPEINLRLRPKILGMPPGTRVVSNTFDMGDWPADQTIQVRQGCKTYCKVLFWIVPARVNGTWRMAQGELRLEQTYQRFGGTLASGSGVSPVTNARIRGDQIAFTAGGTHYLGRVSGNVIEGTTSRSGGKQERWRAERTR